MSKPGRNSRSPLKQLRQIDSESSSSISAKSKVSEVKEDFYATKQFMMNLRKLSSAKLDLPINGCDQKIPDNQQAFTPPSAKLIPKRMQSSGNLISKAQGVQLTSPAKSNFMSKRTARFSQSSRNVMESA